jgi:8-oxo-dGTP diphosphatase
LNEIPIFGTRVAGAVYQYRPSAYAMVMNGQGQIAVARTPLACYLPGGGIERDETPERTIVREGQEECGFVLRPMILIGRAMEICFSVEEQTYFEKDSFFFRADIAGNAEKAEGDHELLWLSPLQAIAILTHGSHRWAVQKASSTSTHQL